MLDKPNKDKFLITSSTLTCPAKLIAMAGQAETSIQYLFAHDTMLDIKTRPEF